MKSDLKFDSKGIPILTLREKLDALTYCIKENAPEDVCGHLCDLLWHFGQKIEPSVGPKFQSIQELVAHYGENPTPVEE